MENLDNFSLMEIFDKLDLRDLVKLSILSPRFHQLIVDHYMIAKYRLHEQNLYIKVGYTVSTYFYPNDDNSYSLYTEKNDEVLAILQYFGNMFNSTKIEIYAHGYKYVEEIQSAVNKNCFNTFQEITLHRRHPRVDDINVNLIFLHATDVILEHFLFESIEPMRLDISFPRMRKLIIDRETDLIDHYPHLTEIVFPSFFFSVAMPGFYDFIRFNPQLRSIEMPILNNVTFLTSLSELLPNLETLSLGLFSANDYTIDSFPTARFKHVKKYTLNVDLYIRPFNSWTDSLHQIIDSIEFDCLDSFSVLSLNPESFDLMIELIAKNTELRNVTINSELSFEQLCRLIAPLSKLMALTIASYEPSLRGIWNRFLEHIITNNYSLENINVQLFNYGEITHEDLLEIVPIGWSVSGIDTTQHPQLLHLERS